MISEKNLGDNTNPRSISALFSSSSFFFFLTSKEDIVEDGTPIEQKIREIHALIPMVICKLTVRYNHDVEISNSRT